MNGFSVTLTTPSNFFSPHTGGFSALHVVLCIYAAAARTGRGRTLLPTVGVVAAAPATCPAMMAGGEPAVLGSCQLRCGAGELLWFPLPDSRLQK